MKDVAIQTFVDEYGNVHYKGEELASGGQGIVYRTRDPDLAIKHPLDANGQADKNANLREVFKRVRTLPLPKGIPISLPLAILRDQPGYVMKLLNGMKPFEAFFPDCRWQAETADKKLPEWLSQIKVSKFAKELWYCAETGSTRRRLYALYKCAAILARLHAAGIVYGDISRNNVFIGEGTPCECWLIDADNMRLELPKGGSTVYTPRLGAPEIVQGRDAARPRTDCWAFAVMAFQMLAFCHPFLGRKAEGDWSSDSQTDNSQPDLYEQAYAGHFPFVDDLDDDSNELPENTSALPRELVFTPELRDLFQATLGVGRNFPWRRPSMMFWAKELACAFDQSLVCPGCGMSYFATSSFKICPYCQMARPSYAVAGGRYGQMVLQHVGEDMFEVELPHRLFHPFSLAHGDECEYEVEVNLKERTILPVRGTGLLPSDLKKKFVNCCPSGEGVDEV